MTAGRLAAKKPGATTNTVLYRCPTTVTGSTVVNVCNQSGSAATYRMALRNYDQVLHLDGPESQNGGSASTYKFAKGNPFSAYKLNLLPGYQYADALPGTEFTTTNGATAKILDVFIDKSDKYYYTIVADVSDTALLADSQAGTFTGGETITGATSGFTGTYRGGALGSSLTLEMATASASTTSLQISRNTGLSDGMLLTLDGDDAGGEIASIDVGGINTTTNTLTITRGVLGTTAATIPAGRAVNAWTESATVTTIDEGATFVAGDGTLTVLDSTGFISGSYIKIDNEICSISDVNGNDITIDRGRFGTADVDHNNGVNVTLLTDNGIYLVNYFTEGETVTGQTSNASADLGFSTTDSAVINTKYLVSETQGATDHIQLATVTLNIDRTYIFDLSDASNNNYPLKFSADSPEGPNDQTAPGTEYTQGVSKVGTAGTPGAYTSIVINDTTATNLFAYADGTPQFSTTGVGWNGQVNENPTYTEVFVYDVGGEALVAGDTFTVNNVTQTVEANGVTPGAYGYVQEWFPDKAHLKITLGEGSQSLADNVEFYDTPTLNNGDRVTVKVVDGKILSINNVGGADANRAAGTYPNLIADATGASGDIAKARFTVVVDGAGAATVTIVDGGEDFAVAETIQINDGQLGNGGGAALTFDVATISTGVAIDQTGLYSDEDYLFYDNSVAANETEKNSAIIVGPGENLLVYSSAGDLSYVANGFESPSDDFTVINMTKVVTEDDGGGAAAPAP
jgi:hypothetical protein